MAQRPWQGRGWHHLSASFDGTTARLYLDGNEAAKGSPLMGPVTEPELLIGPDFISNQEEGYRYDQPHLPAYGAGRD